jgi:hypothetical protein
MDLAPRPLFFKGASVFVVAESVHSWSWWIWVVIGVWAVLLVVFVLVWRFIAGYFFGPRINDDDAQVEALRRWELQRFFRKQRKRKK